jgi:hypothetical protein
VTVTKTRENPLSFTPESIGDRVDALMDSTELLIREAFQEGKGPIQWDPTQFPRAKNVIDWITNPIFLNRDTLYDFPRQYQILRDSYGLLCPHCNKILDVIDCWDRSVYDMQHDVLLEYGICPKCGVTRSKLRESGLVEEITEVIGVIGMRSGKTIMGGSYDATYVAHRYLSLKDPIHYFGIDRATIIEAGFFAASETQTEETIWGRFTSALIGTDWYARYLEDLKAFAERLHLPWDAVYRPLSSSIRIVPQSLQFVRYHSNAATTAGRTRFFVGIDEMGLFKAGNTDEIHSIPNASLKTLKSIIARKADEGENDIPPVRLLEIGSRGPDPERDPLEHRYVAATTLPMSGVYTARYATWEANKYITRASLENEFLSNPVLAEQQYGVGPLIGGKHFFPERLVDGAFSPLERPGIYWSVLVRPATSGDQTVYYHQVVVQQINLGMTDGPLMVAADAGKTRDRFALAFLRILGSGSSSLYRLEGIIQIIPGMVDTPRGKQQTEVFYPCILPIIKQLNEICKVSMVIFDRWDSTMLTQQIREMGVPAIQRNTKKEDYQLARGEFSAGRVRIPCMVPPHMAPAYEALRTETHQLQQDADGKIDHPPGKHNDVVQVVCQAISSALEFPELLKKARKESNTMSHGLTLPPALVRTFTQGKSRVNSNSGERMGAGMVPDSVRSYYALRRRRGH